MGPEDEPTEEGTTADEKSGLDGLEADIDLVFDDYIEDK